MSLNERQMKALADELGIDDLRKVRFSGTLKPLSKRDWRFTGHIGATVDQMSVISLDPVTTRIEEDIERTWIDGLEPVTAEESETPDDVDREPLGFEIDMGTVLAEALALALPDYPRGDEEAVGQRAFTEPGKDAMTDDDAKPFAGLAALRDKLAGGDGDD
ncbi:MAG: YceD family protein [Pseudomonadota bacterium]|nr:YceD family protein [Pseudomonadota bacterium]